MIDIEEVVKNLKCVIDMELNKWSIEHMDNAITALKQLQAENKQLREAQEWISVKDKLPEEGQKVLSCYLGVYQADIVVFWKDTVNHHFGHQPATHWKPLPKPPEAKQ